MSWRTIYITDAEKISLNLGHLQIKSKGETYYVSLKEISTVVLEDDLTVISKRLLVSFAECGIPMIILGNDHLPIGEYQPISNHCRTAKRYKQQFAWDEIKLKPIWENIVYHKIRNQIKTLEMLEKPEKIGLLNKISSEINNGDIANREGLAARIYFKALFGDHFIRFNEDLTNICLNFTYHIIRCLISKEIIARGYTPTRGISHKSEYNQFNLSDDFIEVYRPIADYFVYCILNCNGDGIQYDVFDKQLKTELLNIANKNVIMNSSRYSLSTSIPVYINNLFSLIESAEGITGKHMLQFPTLEEINAE